MKKTNAIWIHLAAAISVLGVVIHLASIIGGASWYAYFGAPPSIVESARAGTWLAPLGTLLIALLMAICAAYALSALKVIRRLPLLRIALASIAVICILRALVLIPVALKRPDLLNTFEIVAALIWGIAGVGFVFAFRTTSSGA